jgi:Tfp pilus assembly protein PilF
MYDDDTFVYENPVIKAGLTASSLVWAFGLHFANWHPLTWFSYLMDSQIFGMHAGGFHLVNILMHAASAVLLFLALCRMTGQTWRCAVVAAIFAVHSLHVESVAWVAERKDVLSTFLEMLALLFYVRYVERPTIQRYLPIALAFTLGVMSKPMLVTFPAILLLVDFWPLQRIQWPPRWPRDRRPILEKAPLLLISVVASALTVVAQRAYGTVASLSGTPIATRIENSATAYVTYIKQAFWPVNLAVLYPATSPDRDAAILALFLLALVTIATLIFARKWPYLFMGWFWYLCMLLPVIGIVQVGAQSHADRYMYVPLVGLTLAIVWGVGDWLEANPALRRPVAAITAVVLLALTVGAWRQVGYWKDSRTLFEHTIAVTERNYIMQNNLGVILSRAGDRPGAMAQYMQSMMQKQDYAEPRGNIGDLLLREGKLAPAKSLLQDAIRINPDFQMALTDLGIIEASTGEFQQSIDHLNRSLQLFPRNAVAHSNLCYSLEHVGRLDEAIAHCREALRLDPNYSDAQYNLRNSVAERQLIGRQF